MIEALIYNRLLDDGPLNDVVSGRIFPTVAPENTPEVPHIIYTVSPAEVNTFTTGNSSLAKYDFQLDCYAVDLKAALDVLQLAKAALNGWREGSVQWCFYRSQGTSPIEPGQYAYMQFTIYVNEANVSAQALNTSVIRTGSDYIELEACDQIFRLDCDGITLNGETIGGGSPGEPEPQYIHNQNTPATTWTVNHSLDRYPVVVVVDSGGTVVLGDLVYNNTNTVTLTFGVAFGGYAYCS